MLLTPQCFKAADRAAKINQSYFLTWHKQQTATLRTTKRKKQLKGRTGVGQTKCQQRLWGSNVRR